MENTIDMVSRNRCFEKKCIPGDTCIPGNTCIPGDTLIFKTSISRNHAYRVLHSRFPPFGFVLKPVWLVHMFLGELWWTSGRLRPKGRLTCSGQASWIAYSAFSPTNSVIFHMVGGLGGLASSQRIVGFGAVVSQKGMVEQ